MTERSDDTTPTEERSTLDRFADAFDRPSDPLAALEDDFVAAGLDPFAAVMEADIATDDLREATVRQYRSVFAEWTEYMATTGRHHACPNVTHVVGYIDWLRTPPTEGGVGNHPDTVKGKLRKLNRAYTFWQEVPELPHPQDYNPFALARKRVNLDAPPRKPHRPLPVSELRGMLASVQHLRARAIIGMQLKLGLRAGELSNIRLADLSLANEEIQKHFPAMGTAHAVADYDDAIYIPSRADRPGNKSERPRVLPLDDELRTLLIHYLLVRPDNGEPWVFLSQKSHTKIDKRTVNTVWKDAFHPEYAETEEYRPITSHFGRHRFTTWWRVNQDANRQHVKYMRGDKNVTRDDLPDHAAGGARREAIDEYIHVHYEDIEDVYRKQIYKLLPGVVDPLQQDEPPQ